MCPRGRPRGRERSRGLYLGHLLHLISGLNFARSPEAGPPFSKLYDRTFYQ